MRKFFNKPFFIMLILMLLILFLGVIFGFGYEIKKCRIDVLICDNCSMYLTTLIFRNAFYFIPALLSFFILKKKYSIAYLFQKYFIILAIINILLVISALDVLIGGDFFGSSDIYISVVGFILAAYFNKTIDIDLKNILK